jgi:hypothetical protein
MTPTYRHSFSGIWENVRWWVSNNQPAVITLLASLVLIAAMFLIVAHWDRRDKNRNRRL